MSPRWVSVISPATARVTRDGEETTEALIIAAQEQQYRPGGGRGEAQAGGAEPTLPAGTVINVFYDRATLIDTAIHTISSALFEAILIVVVLLAVFLGNIRAALVVSLSLPLAALATFT